MTTKPIPDVIDPIEQLKRIPPERIQSEIMQTEAHLVYLKRLSKALASFLDPGETPGAKPQPAAKRGKRAGRGSLIEPLTQCLREATAPLRCAEIARAIGGARLGQVYATLKRNPDLFSQAKDKTWRLK
jgi:hypothetical protein